MILAPSMLYQRFLSPATDLRMLQQISNTYGNSMGWLNSANTGNGAAASYQQVSVPTTTSDNSRLHHRQCCRPTTDCGAGSHR